MYIPYETLKNHTSLQVLTSAASVAEERLAQKGQYSRDCYRALLRAALSGVKTVREARKAYPELDGFQLSQLRSLLAVAKREISYAVQEHAPKEHKRILDSLVGKEEKTARQVNEKMALLKIISDDPVLIELFDSIVEDAKSINEKRARIINMGYELNFHRTAGYLSVGDVKKSLGIKNRARR